MIILGIYYFKWKGEIREFNIGMVGKNK